MAQAAAVVIPGVICLRANLLVVAKHLHLADVKLLLVEHPLAVAKLLHLVVAKLNQPVAAKHLHHVVAKLNQLVAAKHLLLADVKHHLVAAKHLHLADATALVDQARAVVDCCRNCSAAKAAAVDVTAAADVQKFHLVVAKHLLLADVKLSQLAVAKLPLLAVATLLQAADANHLATAVADAPAAVVACCKSCSATLVATRAADVTVAATLHQLAVAKHLHLADVLLSQLVAAKHQLADVQLSQATALLLQWLQLNLLQCQHRSLIQVQRYPKSNASFRPVLFTFANANEDSLKTF